MKIVISDIFNAKEKLSGRGPEACANPWTFTISIGNFILLPEVMSHSQCGFCSYEEASIFIKENPFTLKNKVALVLKNADFTEGRGPMIPFKIFKRPDKAHDYVMKQEGIYGSKPYHEIRYGVNISGGLYGIISYNGYDIKLVDLE